MESCKKIFSKFKLLSVVMAVTIILTGCTGKQGEQGEQGPQGIAGKDGKTPTITINADGYWVINGEVTNYKAVASDGKNGVNGQEGKTPTITINKDGYWVINGVVTEYKAVASDGKNGTDGKDGETPTITINKDGYWVINGEVTNVKALGKDGADGKPGTNGVDGKTPTIEINEEGYWVINGVVTEYKAVCEEEYSWENKTAVFVGDSITYGTGTTNITSKTYWSLLENTLSLSSVTGMGVNSSTISSQSDYGTTKEPLINRYITIPEADLISIFMGTNDYGHETPLGTINDTTDVSFYGALNVIIPNLQKALPNSRIVLVTPIHRYGRGTSGILGTNYTYDNLPNGVGANLEDYVNAIKEIGAKYDVPVIDLYTLFDLDPSDENIRNEYIPDGLHPNDAGHQIMADLIAKELAKISPIRKSSDNDSSGINDVKIEYGNDYGSANLNSLKRVSVSKNVYLEAGTVISLVNPEEFKYALYSQTSEDIVYSTNVTNGYITTDYTVTTSGWYGFVFAHIDDSEFDLGGTDSNLLVDYIEFAGAPEEPETDLNVILQIGNDYGTSTGDTPTRASVSKNIYLKEGTVISVKDASIYKYAVYNLPSEEIAISTNISGGYINTDFTINNSGWYGFVLSKETDFDLGGTDSNLITDYLNFN